MENDEQYSVKSDDKEAKDSVIIIRFSGSQTADPSISMGDVSPFQGLLAADVLRLIAERELHRLWQVRDIEEARKRQELIDLQMAISRGGKLS